jgi:isopentenyl-diphosphate delta-isomerase
MSIDNPHLETERRKRDHLRPFRGGQAPSHDTTTWLECVHLIHNALPEMSFEQLDSSASFAGHRFKAPVFITGMTGGTEEAGRINRELAVLAEKLGIGFGLGSVRAMLENPDLIDTYQVRQVAPDVFLASNLGAQQLLRYDHQVINAHLQELGASALCIHLNPAQELFQPEGDRDFRGILDAIEQLVAQAAVPIIVKECGCGLGRSVCEHLQKAGVRQVDVAGSGGTSWIGLELQRQTKQSSPDSHPLWNWGIPTAAAVAGLADSQLQIMASGGIRTGLDAARAIALGADMVGLAAPIMQTYLQHGVQAVEDRLNRLIDDLRRTMLLVGARTIPALQKVDRVISDPLKNWLSSTAPTG